MEITMMSIITIVTAIMTYLFGLLSKKITWFKDEHIPLQNFVIGVISGIICGLLNIDGMNITTAIITCLSSSMAAGGIYDMIKSK